MLAMFSASSAHADEAINAKIEKAERLLLGKTASNQPVESRLDTVEMNLYGKTKHGSVVKRVDAISDFLGIKDDNSGKAPISADSKSEPKSQPAETESKPDVASQDTAKVDADKAEAAKAEAAQSEIAERAVAQAAAQAAAEAERAKVDLADSKKRSAPGKVSTAGKVGLIPLKSLQAKMATPSPPPGRADDSMPPSAPSIASTMNKPGFNSQARQLLREGLRQYANSQYSDAEDSFRRVLTVDPRNADAFYNLGSLAEHNHDYVIALTNYRAALNFNSKDKDYIAAVTAMEHQLSASKPSSAASTNATRTATLGHFQVPVDAATSSAPLTDRSPVDVSTGPPFQLSGTQNDVLINTTQFNNNYTPTMNVNQRPPPPTMGVAQQVPKKGGGFGKVMNVGMRAALYSSGLHCPICRMMGGGFHF